MELLKDRKFINLALIMYAVFIAYKIGEEAINLARHKAAAAKIDA